MPLLRATVLTLSAYLHVLHGIIAVVVVIGDMQAVLLHPTRKLHSLDHHPHGRLHGAVLRYHPPDPE